MMVKKKPIDLLYECKVGNNLEEMANSINAFGPGTAFKRSAQRQFGEFRGGNVSLEDESMLIDNLKLKTANQKESSKLTLPNPHEM
ncbi:hypothetical protein ANCCAN_17399 [Ancylostoma caninum]|uniref:Mos1 transposase HTH domain-containing protein n=1 Tax=Ancylostoma caninum TaxID=29170 RepID=A0A368FWZ5_ANCCA|nr:hypothetical protein ANCCAN_17399 [Ancylostoma caninum]